MTTILIALFLATLDVPQRQTVVTTEWLANHLDDLNVVVLEVRETQVPAIHAHIPKAHTVALDQIAIDKKELRDELPSVEKLRLVFENAGIGDTDNIILYGDNPLAVTRTFFTLDVLGHGNRVSILDGGFAKWRGEYRPVTNAPIDVQPQTFTPNLQPQRLATMKEVQQVVSEHSTNVLLLDARSSLQYRGLKRGASTLRRGHIPGAHCLPWSSNLQREHNAWMFRSWPQLQDMYTSLEVKPGTKTIVYCRTGLEASMPYFILRSLGYDVALYDGSANEWTRHYPNPMAFTSR